MGKRPGETASQYEKHMLLVHLSGHSQLALTSSPLDGTNFLARYGWSNGPLIYQLQRELSSMVQEDLSLTAYLTNVTKLWNELNCLALAPKCVYETFNNEGSQILLLDRLPSVKKAFSMLYTVEQQRAIQTTTKISTNNVAYQLTMKGTKRDDDKYVQKKKFIANKENLLCSHCRRLGHGKYTYFQLHGICDWYKSLNERRKKGRAFAANVDVKSEGMQGTSMGNTAEMMSELIKLL
ncbi:UNVERIFIED_CONTAM: hypothetical protein Sindi_1846100 [Sesamum indicum]